MLCWNVTSPESTDISFVSVKEAGPKACFDMSFHRTMFRSNKVDWDSFKSYRADVPNCYANLWMNHFWRRKCIPHNNYRQIPNWFTTKSAVNIAHCYHYYNIYPREWCSRTFAEFKTTQSHCKNVLENEMCGYVQVVRTKVESRRRGPMSSGKYLSKFSIYAYY